MFEQIEKMSFNLPNNIIIAILVPCVVLYIRYKSKSGFFIDHYLWFWIIRHKTEQNDQLIKDILDIERFNYLFNASAISLNQIKRFELWVNKYELNFRYLKRLKDYFDIEKLKIRKISRGRIRWVGVFILMFWNIFAIFTPITLQSSTALLIKINDQSGWFWIKPDKAQEFTVLKDNPWKISKTQCINSEVKTGSLTVEGRNAICQLFKKIDQDDILTIQKKIKSQLQFCVFMDLIFFFMLIYYYRKLLKMVISVNVRRTLYKRLCQYRQNRLTY